MSPESWRYGEKEDVPADPGHGRDDVQSDQG